MPCSGCLALHGVNHNFKKGTEKNASFKSMDAMYTIGLDITLDIEDIIDGSHFEMFMVDKLIKTFQIQYHYFTFIFFISGENN